MWLGVATRTASKLTKTDAEAIPTKDGHLYNSTVRMCIYNALQNQCPVDRAADMVKFVAEAFTGQMLQTLPCAAMVSQISRELGMLGDMQAAEVNTFDI